MKLLAPAFAALALAACAAVPPPPPPVMAPPAPLIDAARMAEHVRVLSSDEFAGRGPATEGERKTVAYIAQQMAAAGLQPGGENGTWYQMVAARRFENVGEPTSSFRLGDWNRPLDYGAEIVVGTQRPVDRITVTNAPLVFAGYGVEAPERNWNDFAGVDVKGKVLVVLVNDPDFENQAANTFGGKAMTYYGRWTYKFEEAAEKGAAGVLIVHETEPASYGWATVENSWGGPTFDIVRQNPNAERAPVQGWIQRPVAEELFRRAGLDFEQMKAAARQPGFKAVPLGDATFSTDFGVRTTTVSTPNVLGIVRGSTRPNETIMYGGHWDHLGSGTPDAQGDAIFNGAVDNATGIAAILEIGRAFAQAPRPERSIVVAAWTLEEQGLLGSEYYAANPIYPLETTVAGFNIDAMEPWGPARDVVVVGYGQSDLEDRLERILAGEGQRITPDPSPQAGYFFRSDHFPMAKRGVPMLYADTGQDLLEGGTAAGEAAAAAYRRDRYHQVNDEYDPATWNFAGMVQQARVLYRMGLDLANGRDWPNYRATSEFRPERDKTAATRR